MHSVYIAFTISFSSDIWPSPHMRIWVRSFWLIRLKTWFQIKKPITMQFGRIFGRKFSHHLNFNTTLKNIIGIGCHFLSNFPTVSKKFWASLEMTNLTVHFCHVFIRRYALMFRWSQKFNQTNPLKIYLTDCSLKSSAQEQQKQERTQTTQTLLLLSFQIEMNVTIFLFLFFINFTSNFISASSTSRIWSMMYYLINLISW